MSVLHQVFLALMLWCLFAFGIWCFGRGKRVE